MIFCGGTAIPRTIDFPAFAEIAHEVGAVLVADIAHIAGLVAGGAHPSPVGHADVITTTTHKTLRGPRGAMLMTHGRARQGDRQGRLPRPAGRPAQPHHRRHRGRAARGGASRRSATTPTRSWPTPRRWPTALLERGFDLVSGGTDNHLILIDLTGKGIGGKPAAKALDRAGIELNYNTVPFDPRKPFDPSGMRIGTPALTTRGLHRGAHAARSPPGSTRPSTPPPRTTRPALDRIAGEVRDLLAAFPMPGWH